LSIVNDGVAGSPPPVRLSTLLCALKGESYPAQLVKRDLMTPAGTRAAFLICSIGSARFTARYVHIYDATQQRWLPFTFWPAQHAVLTTTLAAERKLVVLKARQLGISWLSLAYALWLLVCRPPATVFCYRCGKPKNCSKFPENGAQYSNSMQATASTSLAAARVLYGDYCKVCLHSVNSQRFDFLDRAPYNFLCISLSCNTVQKEIFE